MIPAPLLLTGFVFVFVGVVVAAVTWPGPTAVVAVGLVGLWLWERRTHR